MLPIPLDRPTCGVCYAEAKNQFNTCEHMLCKTCSALVSRSHCRSSRVAATCPWCPSQGLNSAQATPNRRLVQGNNHEDKRLQGSASLPALFGPRGTAMLGISESSALAPLNPPSGSPASRESTPCKSQHRAHTSGLAKRNGCLFNAQGFRKPKSSGTLRIATLLGRISSMTLAEVPHFVQHVTWLKAERLVAHSDIVLLSHAVRQRTGEVFGLVSLQAIDSAKTALSLLTDRRQMFGGDCTPRRAFETRIGYIAYRSEGKDEELDVLIQCYVHVAEMQRRCLVSPDLRVIITSRLLHWLEFASLVQIRQQASSLRGVVLEEISLVEKIRVRVHQRAFQNFGNGQLQPFIRLLIDLESQNLVTLDGGLEETLVQQIRRKVDHLVIEKLSAEIEGEFLELCRRRDSVRVGLVSCVSWRVEQEIISILASLNRSEDPNRRKQDLLEWGKFVSRAGEAGLVNINPARQEMIVDALHDCTVRCFDSKERSSPKNILRELQRAELVIRKRNLDCV